MPCFYLHQVWVYVRLRIPLGVVQLVVEISMSGGGEGLRIQNKVEDGINQASGGCWTRGCRRIDATAE